MGIGERVNWFEDAGSCFGWFERFPLLASWRFVLVFSSHYWRNRAIRLCTSWGWSWSDSWPCVLSCAKRRFCTKATICVRSSAKNARFIDLPPQPTTHYIINHLLLLGGVQMIVPMFSALLACFERSPPASSVKFPRYFLPRVRLFLLAVLVVYYDMILIRLYFYVYSH